jgi:hypothetical protein
MTTKQFSYALKSKLPGSLCLIIIGTEGIGLVPGRAEGGAALLGDAEQSAVRMMPLHDTSRNFMLSTSTPIQSTLSSQPDPGKNPQAGAPCRAGAEIA